MSPEVKVKHIDGDKLIDEIEELMKTALLLRMLSAGLIKEIDAIRRRLGVMSPEENAAEALKERASGEHKVQ